MISRRLLVSAPLLAGAATLVPARAPAQAGTRAARPCDTALAQQAIWSSYYAGTRVGGYADRHSIAPGEKLSVMLSTGPKHKEVGGKIEVFRIGYYGDSDRKRVLADGPVKVVQNEVQLTAASLGACWPSGREIETDAWETSYYTIDFIDDADGQRDLNVAFSAYWQVRYGDLDEPAGRPNWGRQLVCYKDDDDPIRQRVPDEREAMMLVTAMFRQEARRPETMLMGVAYQSYFEPESGAKYPYFVARTDLPFFAGTGYQVRGSDRRHRRLRMGQYRSEGRWQAAVGPREIPDPAARSHGDKGRLQRCAGRSRRQKRNRRGRVFRSPCGRQGVQHRVDPVGLGAWEAPICTREIQEIQSQFNHALTRRPRIRTEDVREDPVGSLVIEFWSFLRARKKFWLAPMMIMMALFGGLLALTQGSVIAPFIYSLF
jgi:hypothetical protein